jgi:DNA-directed RNA polymerase subunit omega
MAVAFGARNSYDLCLSRNHVGATSSLLRQHLVFCWTEPMRDDYLQAALKIMDDPNILVNVVSTRVKQLRRGSRAMVESLEKLSLEDVALREIMEGKINFELAAPETLRR